jgi:hypothetical protein
MTQRYVVPEEGKQKYWDAYNEAWRQYPNTEPEYMKETECANKGLEAFIRWQSENPRVPTVDQQTEMSGLIRSKINNPSVGDFAEEWQRRMYLSPEPEYGVCKKCGARVQDGATKSHSSAAGTLLPGHTEPEVLPCSKCGSKDRNQFINILVCCGCSRILAHIINGKAEYIKGSLRENTEPSVPEEVKDPSFNIFTAEIHRPATESDFPSEREKAEGIRERRSVVSIEDYRELLAAYHRVKESHVDRP